LIIAARVAMLLPMVAFFLLLQPSLAPGLTAGRPGVRAGLRISGS
jgi:ABC-type glycerol-3-phosphate transport system permease component